MDQSRLVILGDCLLDAIVDAAVVATGAVETTGNAVVAVCYCCFRAAGRILKLSPPSHYGVDSVVAATIKPIRNVALGGILEVRTAWNGRRVCRDWVSIKTSTGNDKARGRGLKARTNSFP
ncbi:hypothetical protein PoB_006464000 [Plakobranchus ocellatus]|uniref:Uncharacterized protein n=1 Tax=Plakobranchus ocellatus TaxID=259542 RepID=A0AAV4D252_9GAST|nr:hypothetical protein PoB_006464000 [Plakobranchus ocellatus]